MTAWVDGPKQKGDWNLTISNGYNRLVGHIFRGAFRYHYRYIDGLQRPYRPSGKRTIIVGKDDNTGYGGLNYIVFPVLKVARYFTPTTGSDIEYGSDEFFGITIHELAHTSHVITMNAGIIQFSQVDEKLQESWPIAVQWHLTNIDYRSRGISSYGNESYNPTGFLRRPHRFAYQNWSLSGATDSKYTNLFINLVDNYNVLGNFFPGFGTSPVNDQVSGYTLAGIESSILKHVYGISSLGTKLKATKPSGITDLMIDNLLSNY